MFYDRFVGLCKERGVSPSAVMVSIGLNKSNATFWKKGSIPKGDTLQKLADYFGVSVDYLLGKADSPNAEAEWHDCLSQWKELSEQEKKISKELIGGVSSLRDDAKFYQGAEARAKLEQLLAATNLIIETYSQVIEGLEHIKKEKPERLEEIPDIEEDLERMRETRNLLSFARDSELFDSLRELNQLGRNKVKERIEELTEIPRYRAETAPQSPPAPQEGQDSTPPPDAPETPPEGE